MVSCQEESHLASPPRARGDNQEVIDYEKVDENIRELVRRLNRLPFVSTIESCESHLRGFISGVVPDSGCGFIDSGSLIFNINKADPQWRVFKERVDQLIGKYPFAKIYEHHCGNEGCQIEGSQCIHLDYDGLTHPETITEVDSFETMIKKKHQVELDIGGERIKKFRQFWSEFTDITGDFL